MSSTTFQSGTVITAPWLNDVNAVTYKTVPDIISGAQPVPVADNAVTTGKIANGSVTAGKIADNAVTTSEIADANVTPTKLSNSGYELGMRNRIINGDMRIDQRNNGASVTLVNSAYITDRFYGRCNQSSKLAMQQNSGGITPPPGFSNYLGATSLSAHTLSTYSSFGINQFIEGFNISDLAWGTPQAKTITLSFWVRSSLTGTFGGSLNNGDYNRSYAFSYTVNAANTWELKTITIPGDTGGVWLTNNGIGIQVNFSLGDGSAATGAAGAWTSGYLLAPTGATSLVSTNGATFYLTGVQLEKGSTATPFEFRPYGTELAMCQRYYESGSFDLLFNAQTSGVFVGSSVFYKVSKRTSPTVSQSNFFTNNCAATTNTSSITADKFLTYRVASAAGTGQYSEYWTASSEL